MTDQDLEDQVDQKELAPGVLLIKEYKKIENDPNIPDIVGIFTFKVQLKTMNVVDFEVYLNQSENIELENKEGDELYKYQSIYTSSWGEENSFINNLRPQYSRDC